MTVGKSQELKQLQIRKTRLEVELNSLVKEVQEMETRCDTISEKIAELDQKMKRLKDSGIVISEHAFLRYFERVLNYDLGTVRGKIISEAVEDQVKVVGSGKFCIEGEHYAIVKNKVVITVT